MSLRDDGGLLKDDRDGSGEGGEMRRLKRLSSVLLKAIYGKDQGVLGRILLEFLRRITPKGLAPSDPS